MSKLKEWQIQKENGIFDKRNQINNLTGKEWLYSTRSVKTKNYEYYYNIQNVLDLNYVDFMPIELISELILTFSKDKSIIIDPISNFGSIGYATSNAGGNRIYYGYNYIETNSIGFSKQFDLSTIYFHKESIENNFDFSKLSKNCILLTELIFNSLNYELRNNISLKFKYDLKNSIKILLDNKINVNYVIIAVQNTKENSKYIFNTTAFLEIMESFNYNLKSEIIWKIFDDYFKRIKENFPKQNENKSNDNLLLNDKRILVFKRD